MQVRSGPVWVHVMDPVPVVWINSDLAEAHADATGKCVWGVQRDGGLTHAVPACVVISLKQQGNGVNATLPLIC